MQKTAKPRETLSIADATAIIVGMMVGIGIFKTPSIVAASAGSEGMLILFWLAGGIASFIGALCYAELTSAYPHAGGDYHYLSKAFGPTPAFFYGWGRLSVIQTGSIVMVAFIIGDYASEILFLGPYSTSLYAAAAVVALTALNVAGLRQSKVTQKALIGLIVLGLAGIAVCGFWLGEPRSAATAGPLIPESAALGTAMIFVLLTYGGWNEAAFLSAEVKSPRKNMVKVLLLSIAVVTVIYAVVNLALLNGLGLSDMASSSAVMADLMRRAVGDGGARFVSFLILLACLSTMNAAVITGARTAYAVGRDHPVLGFLGRWHGRKHTPVNALLFQGCGAFAGGAGRLDAQWVCQYGGIYRAGLLVVLSDGRFVCFCAARFAVSRRNRLRRSFLPCNAGCLLPDLSLHALLGSDLHRSWGDHRFGGSGKRNSSVDTKSKTAGDRPCRR